VLNVGPQELLLILVVALVVVGPKRLPEIGRSIGRGLRELRKAQDEVRRTVRVTLDEETRPTFGDPRPPVTRDPSAASGTDTVADTAAAEAAGGPIEVSEPEPATSPVSELSRTLGRGLAEIRKAREEVQRTFRVELADPSAPTGGPRPAAPPSRPETASRDAEPRDDAPGHE
jgi:TatA/E family protein of Tat protein translocase